MKSLDTSWTSGVLADLGVGKIGRAFDFMEICENLIAVAKTKHAKHAKQIDRVFGVACPREMLIGKSDALYTAHVEELIERARGKRGADQRAQTATDAEIIGVLADLSLIEPLSQRAVGLYQRLFVRRMPTEARRLNIVAESVAGVDEIHTRFLNKLFDPTREWK